MQQSRQCPKCGSPASPEMKFCGRCGSSLLLPQQMPPAPLYQPPVNYQQQMPPPPVHQHQSYQAPPNYQQQYVPGRTEGLEYKHLECPQSWVNAILGEYSLFFWDLVATQVVVSKESHLEKGQGFFDSDDIYSVTTTERFATVDLKRRRDIPNLDIIRNVEQRYIAITGELIDLGCSPVNNFAGPPYSKGIGCLGIFLYFLYIFPGVLYQQKIKKDNQKIVLACQQLQAELDGLLTQYRPYLNI
jgi:hypothetical protein